MSCFFIAWHQVLHSVLVCGFEFPWHAKRTILNNSLPFSEKKKQIQHAYAFVLACTSPSCKHTPYIVTKWQKYRPRGLICIISGLLTILLSAKQAFRLPARKSKDSFPFACSSVNIELKTNLSCVSIPEKKNRNWGTYVALQEVWGLLTEFKRKLNIICACISKSYDNELL